LRLVEAPHLELTERDRDLLEGAGSEAEKLAMRVVTKMAEVMGASRLLDVTAAHIDSCLYHGEAGLDFAERLLAGGGRAVVPTTLNVSSLDLLHPDLYRGDQETATAARAQMDAYTTLGCTPTWTCAPYQLPDPPVFGEHVAWAESNAIVFANSVLGARTNRYGDFIDICAAITGRVPAAGLHLDEERRGQVVFDLANLNIALRGSDALMPVLGHLIGRRTGSRVAVVDGLEATTPEGLKALGAAAASSGAVGLIHAVGVTPEAPTLAAALHEDAAEETILVDGEMLRAARDDLTTTAADALDAVSLGTPHASAAELRMIAARFDGRVPADRVAVYVSTSRDVLATSEKAVDVLTALGIHMVTDTCTYITPILDPTSRVVMTDSAKWAFYAPGNIGVDVVFGTTSECVESAVAGVVSRDPELWM